MGIDNDDANKLKFSSDWDSLSEATKMTLTTAGKVGIGTTSPTYEVHVHGGAAGATIGVVSDTNLGPNISSSYIAVNIST